MALGGKANSEDTDFVPGRTEYLIGREKPVAKEIRNQPGRQFSYGTWCFRAKDLADSRRRRSSVSARAGCNSASILRRAAQAWDDVNRSRG